MVDRKLTTAHAVRVRQAVAILRTLRVPTRMQLDLNLLAGALDSVLWAGTVDGLPEVRRNLRTLRDDPVLRNSRKRYMCRLLWKG